MNATTKPVPAACPAVAFLADGKLYLKEPQRPPRLIESAFAQEIIDRSARTRQRHEWKAKGTWWSLQGVRPGAADGPAADTRRIRVTGVTRGAEGQLLYALDTDAAGGLFAYEKAAGQERRLFHRNQFRARDLCRNPADGRLAFSLAHDDGTANVAVMEAEGRGMREVTEGDSVDEAPSWAGAGRALVFQSAGVGRNAAGVRVALGPYAVQKLDLDSGDLVTLLEDERTDYLVPRLSSDGALYYIRRPYQPDQPSASPLKVMADILLFPFRLAVAVVHFLNFFSIMFARKPLMTAGGPPKEGPDARYMMLWGKVIDAEKALRDSKKGGGRALVPRTWELVRRDGNGDVDGQVLARGVVSFDLCGDGGVVYTDGSGVYHVDDFGTVSPVCDGKMIERVSVA